MFATHAMVAATALTAATPAAATGTAYQSSSHHNYAAKGARDPRSQPPIIIGNSTQLFVDDCIVASKTANLIRSLHRPDCSHVAVTTDAPWEHNYTIGSFHILYTRFSETYKVLLRQWPQG
jgi:hypothetical protein